MTSLFTPGRAPSRRSTGLAGVPTRPARLSHPGGAPPAPLTDNKILALLSGLQVRSSYKAGELYLKGMINSDKVAAATAAPAAGAAGVAVAPRVAAAASS